MAKRDQQRKRVYDAEDSRTVPKGRRFASPLAIQSYCNKITSSYWWKRRYSKIPHIGILVKKGHGDALSYIQEHIIKLPRWAWKESVILHEIAHMITPHKTIDHGLEFCQAYLSLFRWKLGKQAEKKLKESFLKHRVSF